MDYECDAIGEKEYSCWEQDEFPSRILPCEADTTGLRAIQVEKI
jgi:hypothetical protein